MKTKTFLQTVLAAGLLLGSGVFVACTFSINGNVTTETSADSDTIIIKVTTTKPEQEKPVVEEAEEAVEETEEVVKGYSRKDVCGIYDTDDSDRLCFDEDGTGTSGRIGSLNFTSFDYNVNGDEIIITWGDESKSRLKIRDGGKSIYWPEDDLTFIKED